MHVDVILGLLIVPLWSIGVGDSQSGRGYLAAWLDHLVGGRTYVGKWETYSILISRMFPWPPEVLLSILS